MQRVSPISGDVSCPSLPHIGQADYMPLLTEALRAVQPRELFDARIFAGLLFAIIAGEKNLIVDVEVEVDVAVNKDIESDSTLERYGGAGHRQFHERKPLADQIAFRSVDFDFVRAKDVLETKVRRTVEHMASSVFGLTCYASRATSRWTASQVPGCLFTSHNSDFSNSELVTFDPSSVHTSSNSTSLPQILVLTRLHRASRTAQSRIWDMLDRRKVGGLSSGTAVSSNQVSRTAGDDMHEHERELPPGFFVVWIRMSTDRHKQVTKCLLDHFALSCTAEFSAVTRADLHAGKASGEMHEGSMRHGFQVRLDPMLDSEYIWVLRRLSNKTHMHPPLRQQISDLVTSLLSIPSISANLTSTSITDLKAFIRISRVLFRPFTWKAELLNANIVGRQYDQRRKLQEALDQEEWYATAEDAQRIWTNVIRHRIDVQGSRDGNFRFLERTVLDDGSTSASNKATLGGAKPIERGIAAQNIEDAVAGILQDITRRCAN